MNYLSGIWGLTRSPVSKTIEQNDQQYLSHIKSFFNSSIHSDQIESTYIQVKKETRKYLTAFTVLSKPEDISFTLVHQQYEALSNLYMTYYKIKRLYDIFRDKKFDTIYTQYSLFRKNFTPIFLSNSNEETQFEIDLKKKEQDLRQNLHSTTSEITQKIINTFSVFARFIQHKRENTLSLEESIAPAFASTTPSQQLLNGALTTYTVTGKYTTASIGYTSKDSTISALNSCAIDLEAIETYTYEVLKQIITGNPPRHTKEDLLNAVKIIEDQISSFQETLNVHLDPGLKGIHYATYLYIIADTIQHSIRHGYPSKQTDYIPSIWDALHALAQTSTLQTLDQWLYLIQIITTKFPSKAQDKFEKHALQHISLLHTHYRQKLLSTTFIDIFALESALDTPHIKNEIVLYAAIEKLLCFKVTEKEDFSHYIIFLAYYNFQETIQQQAQIRALFSNYIEKKLEKPAKTRFFALDTYEDLFLAIKDTLLTHVDHFNDFTLYCKSLYFFFIFNSKSSIKYLNSIQRHLLGIASKHRYLKKFLTYDKEQFALNVYTAPSDPSCFKIALLLMYCFEKNTAQKEFYASHLKTYFPAIQLEDLGPDWGLTELKKLLKNE